jgi:conjugative relaxase-like TrwC/TraI family protein
VLSLAKVRPGREGYYLEATRGSGRDGRGLVEPDGLWWGSLAGNLGLAGRRVQPAGLSALLAGVDPATGAALDPRHGRVTVAAFDCTFAAPKSVSLLHALGPADAVGEVRAAHEDAVAGALGYLERHAAHVRRAGAVVPVTGFVAASFLHRTSRARDPHLHTHLVVANLAPDADGRWSAIDGRPLYAHAAAAGALYRAHLRFEISRRLSVDWQARADGFADLIGIPASTLRGFSRRQAEIAAELARTGWSGPLPARLAAERTRPDRDLAEDYPTLVAGWRERAFSLGVSGSAVGRMGVRALPAPDAAGERGPELARRVAETAGSLDRPFDRRELIRATCARLGSGAPADRVDAAVEAHLGSGDLVRCGERVVRLRASAGGRIPGGLVEGRYATREIAALTARLASEMESAPVIFAWQGCTGVLGPVGVEPPAVFVTGREGDLVRDFVELRETALAAHRDGRRVVGFAPDRRVASHFEAATGIATAVLGQREAVAGDCLIVVVNPARCPVREVIGLVEKAAARATTLVLVRGGPRDAGTCGPGEPCPVAGRLGHPVPAGSLARHEVAGVEVVLAGDLGTALGGIGLLAEERRCRGRRPLVVAAEPRLLAPLGLEVSRPGEALRRCDGEVDLIVFGGARLLGSGIAHLPDGARCHVAVAPVERDPAGERAIALELAEPAGLRFKLGRSPEGRRAREVWRARAIGAERRYRTRSLDPGRGRDDFGSTRGVRPAELGRRREASLSR